MMVCWRDQSNPWSVVPFSPVWVKVRHDLVVDLEARHFNLDTRRFLPKERLHRSRADPVNPNPGAESERKIRKFGGRMHMQPNDPASAKLFRGGGRIP